MALIQSVLTQEGLASAVESLDCQIIDVIETEPSSRVLDNTLFDPELTRAQEDR